MARTDSFHLVHDSIPATAPGITILGSGPGLGDSALAALSSDGAEGGSLGWESAWIDLGGEG